MKIPKVELNKQRSLIRILYYHYFNFEKSIPLFGIFLEKSNRFITIWKLFTQPFCCVHHKFKV